MTPHPSHCEELLLREQASQQEHGCRREHRTLRRRAIIYGFTDCSRPSSFRSLNEVDVPFASNMTYVSLVPVGPARLTPAASSEAPILTDGRPRSVMSRRSTVSGWRSPFADVPTG